MDILNALTEYLEPCITPAIIIIGILAFATSKTDAQAFKKLFETYLAFTMIGMILFLGPVAEDVIKASNRTPATYTNYLLTYTPFHIYVVLSVFLLVTLWFHSKEPKNKDK